MSYVHAVAADASGVYAAGTFSTRSTGTYLRKYDTRGAELWTKRFENTTTYLPLIVAAGPSGAYFGEVVRHHIGGRWDVSGDDPLEWRMNLPTGVSGDSGSSSWM